MPNRNSMWLYRYLTRISIIDRPNTPHTWYDIYLFIYSYVSRSPDPRRRLSLHVFPFKWQTLEPQRENPHDRVSFPIRKLSLIPKTQWGSEGLSEYRIFFFIFFFFDIQKLSKYILNKIKKTFYWDYCTRFKTDHFIFNRAMLGLKKMLNNILTN